MIVVLKSNLMIIWVLTIQSTSYASRFSGAIMLSVSISPSNGSSPTVALNPNKVTLSSGGTAQCGADGYNNRDNFAWKLYGNNSRAQWQSLPFCHTFAARTVDR